MTLSFLLDYILRFVYLSSWCVMLFYFFLTYFIYIYTSLYILFHFHLLSDHIIKKHNTGINAKKIQTKLQIINKKFKTFPGMFITNQQLILMLLACIRNDIDSGAGNC